jgi:hypothetical protein
LAFSAFVGISRAPQNGQAWISWETGVGERAFAQEIDSAFLRLDRPGIFAIQTEAYVRNVPAHRESIHRINHNPLDPWNVFSFSKGLSPYAEA